MRTAWFVVVVLFVLAPIISAFFPKAFSVTEALIYAVFIGLITLLAWAFRIPPLCFWSIPTAAGLPWLTLLALIFLWASFQPESSKQAAVMSGLFPLFGLIGSVGIAVLVSFFVGAEPPLRPRVIWPMVVSGLLVLSLVLILLLSLIGPWISERLMGGTAHIQTEATTSEATGSPGPDKPEQPGGETRP